MLMGVPEQRPHRRANLSIEKSRKKLEFRGGFEREVLEWSGRRVIVAGLMLTV